MTALASQGPRTYTASGTATNVAATITSTVYPKTLTISNDEAAGGTALYVSWTNVAVAANSDNTNHKILAGETWTYVFNPDNVNNAFALSAITSASTAAYRIDIVGAN